MENFLGNDGKKHIHLISKDKNKRIALEVRSFDGRTVTNRSIGRVVQSAVLFSANARPISFSKIVGRYNTVDKTMGDPR